MTAQPSTARPDVQMDRALFWQWTWQSIRPVLGYVLAGLGFVLLIVGYLGVSREVLVAKQIPYLVSGGLFGIGLVTLGSRLMLIEDLRRDSGRLDRLEGALMQLRDVLLSHPGATPELPTQVSPNGSRSDHHANDVVVLAGGETFHRMDCRMVVNKAGTTPLDLRLAQDEGLKACRLCQPLSVGV